MPRKRKLAKISVFITKTLKFRARIEEPGEPAIEVTIGGREWGFGKGRRYANTIHEICQKIIQTLINEYKIILKEDKEFTDFLIGKEKSKIILSDK